MKYAANIDIADLKRAIIHIHSDRRALAASATPEFAKLSGTGKYRIFSVVNSRRDFADKIKASENHKDCGKEAVPKVRVKIGIAPVLEKRFEDF